MKKIVLVLLAFSFLLTGCSAGGTEQTADIRLIDDVYILLYKAYTADNAWLMHVDKDGVFTTAYGKMVDNDPESMALGLMVWSYFDVLTVQRDTGKLTQKEIESVNDALLTIRQQEEVRIQSTDKSTDLRVCILLNQHEYAFYYMQNETNAYMDFVKLLMDDSPLEITL